MSLVQAGLQISGYVYIKQLYYFIIRAIQTPTATKIEENLWEEAKQ